MFDPNWAPGEVIFEDAAMDRRQPVLESILPCHSDFVLFGRHSQHHQPASFRPLRLFFPDAASWAKGRQLDGTRRMAFLRHRCALTGRSGSIDLW